MEMFEELAKAAQATHEAFLKDAEQLMTPDRAAYVRRLRVDDDYTWRAVAEACYLSWEGEWEPPSNQLMGMALCERAALYFDEDYDEPPWN